MKFSIENFVEAAIIFLIIFTPLAHGAVEPWSIAVLQIISALCFLMFCIDLIKTGKIDRIIFLIIPFIAIFIFYVFVQSLFQISPFNNNTSSYLPGTVYAWATRTELFKIIAYSFIFMSVINFIKTRNQIIRIISVIIGTGLLMSIFFLMRYFHFPAPIGIINPDHFAGYLGMIIPLVIGFILAGSSHKYMDSFYAKKTLLFYIVAVLGAGLFFTMSRGGMLSFIIGLLVMAGLVLIKKNSLRKGSLIGILLIVILISAIIIWLGATPVIEKLLSVKVEISSLYFGGRMPVWLESFNIIRDFPAFGTGFGTFGHIFPKYQSFDNLSMHFSHLHSDYLELLCDTGIAGILIMFIAAAAIAVRAFYFFPKRRNSWITGMSIGIACSLIVISVHSITDFNLHIPGNAMLFIILLAVLFAVLRADNKGSKQKDLIYLKLFSNENGDSGKLSDANFFKKIARSIFFPVKNKFFWYAISVVLITSYIIAVVRPAYAYSNYKNALASKSLNSTWDKTNIAYITKAIKSDPQNSRYHFYLGKIYYEEFLNDQKLRVRTGELYILYAIDAFRKAMELNPWNRKYHQSLAWAYGQVFRILSKGGKIISGSSADYYGKAVNEFETAVMLEPNNPFGYRAYGLWLLGFSSKEKILKGISEYSKAIALKNDLIIEAVQVYKKASGSSYDIKNLVPEMKNELFYLNLSQELKKNNYHSEAKIVLKIGSEYLKKIKISGENTYK